MIAERNRAVDTTERLCEVLERIAGALVDLDNEALLAAEVTLAELIGTCAADEGAPAPDRAAVEAVVARGRTALMRCRRLGASFTGMTRARLSARATLDTYNRTGGAAGACGPAPTVHATV